MKSIFIVLLAGAALAAPATAPARAQSSPAPVVVSAVAAGGLKVNLAHLDSLLVPITVNGRKVLGMAVYAEPDLKQAGKYVLHDAPGEGLYDLDDVARGAIVYLRDYALTKNPASLEKARGLLDFALAVQAPDGTFYNFVDAQGRINTLGTTSHPGITFWAARAVWALSEGIATFQTLDRPYADTLNAALEKVVAQFAADAAAKKGQTRVLDGVTLPAGLP
ncbi:MAG TPA: hypothetical protein VHN99_12410, partial [Deinococcales bacterium]|nr:hypothetical protein [Deinococcales bacterium]